MGEHGQADERFDGAEAEGSSHDQAQLLVQALQRSGGEPEPEAAPDHAKSLRLPLRRSAHRPGHARPWRPMPAAPRESHNSVIQPTDHAEDPFFRGGTRPPTPLTVAYIDGHKDEFGVEPICTTLRIAPSTYYAAKARLPSAMALRDAVLGPLILTLWAANYKVYGVHKMWKAMHRSGEIVGRDQVARLMRQLGIQGVRRGAKVRTTRPDDKADRHPDLVDRQFVAERPNALWVTDLTYVPTWAGVVYVCFIVDAFSRMIVGWRATTNMRTTMVLDALEMARWSRGTQLEGLVCHSDAGSQFTSIRYGERLAELGALPSIGSVGDSYDNALAEATNSLYKTELIRGPGQGPWRGVDDIELATLGWVHWFNNDRLHGTLNDIPPVEYETAYHHQRETNHPVGIQ